MQRTKHTIWRLTALLLTIAVAVAFSEDRREASIRDKKDAEVAVRNVTISPELCRATWASDAVPLHVGTHEIWVPITTVSRIEIDNGKAEVELGDGTVLRGDLRYKLFEYSLYQGFNLRGSTGFGSVEMGDQAIRTLRFATPGLTSFAATWPGTYDLKLTLKDGSAVSMASASWFHESNRICEPRDAINARLGDTSAEIALANISLFSFSPVGKFTSPTDDVDLKVTDRDGKTYTMRTQALNGYLAGLQTVGHYRFFVLVDVYPRSLYQSVTITATVGKKEPEPTKPIQKQASNTPNGAAGELPKDSTAEIKRLRATLEARQVSGKRAADVYFAIAKYHAESGDFDQAVPYARRALQLDPIDKDKREADAKYWNGRSAGTRLGALFEGLSGPPAASLAELDASVQSAAGKRAGLAAVRDNLAAGQKAVDDHDFKGAIGPLTEAINSKLLSGLELACAHYDRSVAHERLGDRAGAIADMDSFVRLAPFDVDAALRLNTLRRPPASAAKPAPTTPAAVPKKKP